MTCGASSRGFLLAPLTILAILSTTAEAATMPWAVAWRLCRREGSPCIVNRGEDASEALFCSWDDGTWWWCETPTSETTWSKLKADAEGISEIGIVHCGA